MGPPAAEQTKEQREGIQESQPQLENPLQQQRGGVVDNEDENALLQSSRWGLTARAMTIRSAARLGFGLASYSTPMVPAPTKVIWLDASLGQWKAKKAIRVDVWDPDAAAEAEPATSGARPHHRTRRRRTSRRPAVINFHGGGFILGQGTDDGRWAMAATAAPEEGLGAVVFSVNYRLAPEYPFPTAVEDCAAAVAQLCSEKLMEDFAVDPARVALSGFSAGATLALACWVALQEPARWGYEAVLRRRPPAVAGFALFYPSLDWTVGRQSKRSMCPQPDLTLPKGLTDLIDASYVYPRLLRSECHDPRLSPGLMPDELLRRLPPVHLCACEYDMLLAEQLAFADRLRTAGREVEVRIVEGAKHAWDKPPPMAPKQSATTEYLAAIVSIRRWLGGAADAIRATDAAASM